MKNVAMAKLEVYENEPIMLIAPKEMLKNFLIYLHNMSWDAANEALNKGLKNTADKYIDFNEQCFKEQKIMKD